MFSFTEKLVEEFVKLALGEDTEMSISEFESKISKDTIQLVRIALGSLNEPAYTTWISMTEYAISRGKFHVGNCIKNIFSLHLFDISKLLVYSGFPLGLEKLENLKKSRRHFPVREILNRLEKSGKITQNTGKLREFQTNIICYFSVIFK